MTNLIQHIVVAKAFPAPIPFLPRNTIAVVLTAAGYNSQPGWGNFDLRINATPNSGDTTCKIDFVGDQLQFRSDAIILDGYTPTLYAAAATQLIYAPDSIGTLKVTTQENSIDVPIHFQHRIRDRLLYSQTLGGYDDSQQIDHIDWSGVYMKALRHSYVLEIFGPDNTEQAVNHCLQQAVAAGLIAGVLAAFVTLGAGLPAAETALTSSLLKCLGQAYTVKLEDQSKWVYWKV
jgi:hypothetical protein